MQVAANGLALQVDDRGPPDGEPLLMVMGLGMPLVAWPDAWVDRLVARGLRVIRFDNRDVGLSQKLHALGVPPVAWNTLRYAMGLPVRAPYTLADMAEDAIGVLDALGLRRAHVIGASMGGMIAQHLAVRHPDRVRTVTLMMTTTGARHLPQPSWRVRQAILGRPDPHDVQRVVQHIEKVMAVIGSPAYPPEPEALRQRLTAMVQRDWTPTGTLRQLVAVAADGDRTGLLQGLHHPVHLIHGQVDPLIPVAAAHDLKRCLPQASMDLIDGMGHDLPPALFDRFSAGLLEAMQRG
jgi:pimeloyl-ACP methyl ester carboxylesterase